MPNGLSATFPLTSMALCSGKRKHRHQPLQQYLSVELGHLAERRSVNDVLDDIEGQRRADRFAAAVADLDEGRSAR